MAATRLVILAANCLYREGLAALLGAEADVSVAATAADWPHALAVVGEQRPAVLLVDLDTPGVEAGIRALRRAAHPPAVVALGADGGDDAAVTWAEMGLAGWISRAATAADVLRVVRDAGRGELRCTARTTAALARRLAEVSATNGRELRLRPTHALTCREREILALIEQGLTNREIAEHLTIALPTVKNHVHHILDKLGARGRLDAVLTTRGA